MKQEQFAGMRARLMEQLQQGVEWSDEAILERIDQLVSEAARENRLPVSRREEIRRELFYSVRKLDILQELLDDDRVTEIMVNGYQKIFVERNGQKSRWEKSFVSREKLEDVVQQIAGKCNRVINENSPIVDARLGKRFPCQCGHLSGRVGRTDSDDPPFSGSCDHDGGSDREREYHERSGNLSGTSGKSEIFDPDRRRDILRQNNISECVIQRDSP